MLTVTIDRQDALADLLTRVCEAPLVPGTRLSGLTAAERLPPLTAR